MECKDLEVFILTYNRANYLNIQLESICNQTAKGFKVRILNNASTDNTLEVIENIKKKYPEREIEVVTHPKNLGNRGNFKKVQELSTTKYCAIFHDDDCFSPEYIETAMQCLYKHLDVGMIACDCTPMYNVNNNNWLRQNKTYLLYDENNYALCNLYGTRQNFASIIYRADIYKTTVIRDDLCGKIWDLPFMFATGIKCKSILLEGQYIRYRLSPKQDSNDYKTGPFPEQVISALSLCKKTVRKCKLYTLILLHVFAQNLYKDCKLQDMHYCSWNDFIKKSKEIGVVTPIELFAIKIFGRKIFIKRIHKFINKKKKQIRKSL